jgi:hypothetical protein
LPSRALSLGFTPLDGRSASDALGIAQKLMLVRGGGAPAAGALLLSERRRRCVRDSPTKEPQTLDWITHCAGRRARDIGANVGSHSMYRRRTRSRSHRLEPSSVNYWILNKNIEPNQGDLFVSATLAFERPSARRSTWLIPSRWRVLSVRQAVDRFDYGVGDGACSSIRRCLLLGGRVPGHVCCRFTHIKVDVDGLEGRSSRAQPNARRPRLQSVLVEVDETDLTARALTSLFERCGLTRAVGLADATGQVLGIYNTIFRRA